VEISTQMFCWDTESKTGRSLEGSKTQSLMGMSTKHLKILKR